MPTVVRRRIVVRKDDVLVVNGLVLDGEVLKDMMDPSKRLLWAFVREDGDVRPCAYDETKVIWIQSEDLVRKGSDLG